jgi:hypothetical protein
MFKQYIWFYTIYVTNLQALCQAALQHGFLSKLVANFIYLEEIFTAEAE